jgi:hypothetical protein
MKALVYSFTEYNNLLYTVSNNNVEISYWMDKWFYIVAEDYNEDVTDEIVYAWLGIKLNVTVVDVVIDIYKEKVAVIYN